MYKMYFVTCKIYFVMCKMFFVMFQNVVRYVQNRFLPVQYQFVMCINAFVMPLNKLLCIFCGHSCSNFNLFGTNNKWPFRYFAISAYVKLFCH